MELSGYLERKTNGLGNDSKHATALIRLKLFAIYYLLRVFSIACLLIIVELLLR